MTVGTDKCVERLHQMPGGAVNLGLKARMDVMFGTASPTLSARNQLQLNYTFGAQRDLDGLAPAEADRVRQKLAYHLLEPQPIPEAANRLVGPGIGLRSNIG